jgi:glucose-1-phosphate adenylyltransferase
MPKRPVQVATIVLAGGQGTRLYPLTIHHSKPAVSYGGRYRLIDIPISNSINSDFRQIFVIAQYLSGELQHHIHQTYQFDHFNPGSVDVLSPQENEQGEKQWFNGTADAVRKNLSTILKSSADYFLILSGDQLYNINFQSMLEFAEEKQADLTIASIPVSHKDAKRMGLLHIDETGKVLDFVEKPQEENLLKTFELPPSFFSDWNLRPAQETCYLGSMGIYVFRREILISLLQGDPRDDFGFHLITTAVQKNRTYSFLYHGYWEDIGTIASYYEANLMLTEEKKGLDTYDETNPIYSRPTYLPGPKIECSKIVQSIICEGSLIEAAEISHSVIGLRSHIRKGSIVRYTVMMGNHLYMPPLYNDRPVQATFGIGENCLIEKAIIDEHVQIGDNVQLVNAQKLDHYDSEGIYIRDGIIIVTAGTIVPNGFVL